MIHLFNNLHLSSNNWIGLSHCIGKKKTNHAPEYRDEAISWLAVFVISVKQHLRGEKKFNSEEVAGFISSSKVRNMHTVPHPCLYVAANIRHALKNAFQITAETPTSISVGFTSDLRLMEKRIDNLIGLMGGLERVKSTPLPIVFVTHLRTFLMVYLLSMPYLYGHLWGWGTIPAISLTGYILLGIDGSAAECESPFGKRANHLAMESYCLNVLRNIEDLYIENAGRRVEERAF